MPRGTECRDCLRLLKGPQRLIDDMSNPNPRASTAHRAGGPPAVIAAQPSQRPSEHRKMAHFFPRMHDRGPGKPTLYPFRGRGRR